MLKSKHPTGQPVSADSIQSAVGAPDDVHPVVFDSINAAVIRNAALHTAGAAGPSGIDARDGGDSALLSSLHLCHSLALLAKRISTTYLDPKGLSPFLACRLIALN